MTSIKFLGATLVLSALLATPASAWEAISEPAVAEAQDPTFSIYSNDGHEFSRTMASHGYASGLHMSVRPPHRGNHTSGVKRY